MHIERKNDELKIKQEEEGHDGEEKWGMTDTREDLIIERWYWNFLFRFELNAPIEFVAFIAATTLHIISRRADVALRPSVNVVFSLQKGEWEKEARERKGTNEASDRELRERTRGSRLLIGTSQLPAASQLAYAHLVCSFSSLVSLPSTRRALSPAIPFFFRHFRTGFSLYFCHFPPWHSPKCIRSVEASTRAPLMDSILYQIGNWLVAVIVIRCAAR